MSKQFKLEVINVGKPEFVKTARGGYNIFELAYKENGRVSGKKMVDFNNPEVYKVLAQAKVGDVFDIESDKNDKGFYDWVSATPGTADAVDASAPKAAAPSRPSYPSKGGRVVGSTYETAEERATRQAAIIRQATLNAAIELLKDGNHFVSEVTKVASQLEDYVYNDLEARARAFYDVARGMKEGE